MEQFLPFLVLIIFGIVSSFAKKKDKKEVKSGGRTAGRSKHTSTAQQAYKNQESVQQEYAEDFGDHENHHALSREIQRSQTRLEMEKRKYKSVMSENKKPNERGLTKEQKEFKKRISNNLNKKGLVNGIIMAEILGKPRAMQPYRSIISKRRGN
ncbi:hypothetical protein [Virgibacillus siamensis]|uniref:hypothetical protein n=1 Tax=Virgibacillus siamensis TaxID=480071 RepID=UPI000987121E|nr:hypothetical protein [Virgibacillus siamensis]